MPKFDLHLHTNNSDGSDSVEELIEKVKSTNIGIFAITDHDTVLGVINAENNIPKDLIFIKGIELTCKADNIKCHILGYNIDPLNKELISLIKKGKILRKQKLETRINYLKTQWNIQLTKEEVDWLYSRKSVVKTHIANILVNRKLSNDNVSAMKKYLDGCKTGDTRFDIREAVHAIKYSGGISVWAHPLGGEGEEHINEAQFVNQLQTMLKFGIEGLECYYSRYTVDESKMLVKYAKMYNLYITGGSDYHGSNKTVKLGGLNTEYQDIDSSELNLPILY